jgi:hypothetical protein
MQVVGGNSAPAVVGQDTLPGKVNYFLGNDPAQWHTHISTFARVEYQNVYPGINLDYYGRQGQLEYDFVVAPGADPSLFHTSQLLRIFACGPKLSQAQARSYIRCSPIQSV